MVSRVRGSDNLDSGIASRVWSANLEDSRNFNQDYVNSNPYPIKVIANDTGANAGVSLIVVIDGQTLVQIGGGASAANIRRVTPEFTVPTGSTYRITAAGSSVLELWKELT